MRPMIAELGAMTARRLARMRGMPRIIGLLITQTAKCFLGEPFAIHRREKAERERRFAVLPWFLPPIAAAEDGLGYSVALTGSPNDEIARTSHLSFRLAVPDQTPVRPRAIRQNDDLDCRRRSTPFSSLSFWGTQ
jgi:hypothetical protein